MKNIILTIIAITSTTLLILTYVAIWYFQEEKEQLPLAFYETKVTCDNKTTLRDGYLREGDAHGYYKGCFQNHGPFYGFIYDRLYYSGNFVNGKRHGTFIYFDEKGDILKKVEYENGNEVH